MNEWQSAVTGVVLVTQAEGLCTQVGAEHRRGHTAVQFASLFAPGLAGVEVIQGARQLPVTSLETLRIHCWDGHNSRLVARLDLPIRGMELHPEGLLVAQTGGWSLVDWDGKEHPRQDLLGSRLLALATHPSGALWACAKTAGGCLIGELSAEGELRHGWAVPEQVSAFSWDVSGRSVYALASGSGNILMLNTGSTNVRRLSSLPRRGGRLGGLAVDHAGGVWTTQLDGWSLAHFDAHGNLDRMVGLPVPTPTDLCIGGVDGKTLYITSARHSLQLEALASAPNAGCLLQMQL